MIDLLFNISEVFQPQRFINSPCPQSMCFNRVVLSSVSVLSSGRQEEILIMIVAFLLFFISVVLYVVT